jgi:hypothetical protein
MYTYINTHRYHQENITNTSTSTTTDPPCPPKLRIPHGLPQTKNTQGFPNKWRGVKQQKQREASQKTNTPKASQQNGGESKQQKNGRPPQKHVPQRIPKHM